MLDVGNNIRKAGRRLRAAMSVSPSPDKRSSASSRPFPSEPGGRLPMMRAASSRRLSPLLLLAVALIALTASLILVPRPASADHRDHHHGPGDGCGIWELDVWVGDGTRHQVDKISRDSTNPTEVKVSTGNPEITVKRQPMDRFVWVYRLHYDDSRPEQYRLARLARFPNRAQGPDFYFRFYLTDEEGSAPLEVGESRMVRIFLLVKHDRLEDCDYKALLSYHLKITRVADGETLGFVDQSTQPTSGQSGDAPPPPPDNRPPTVSSAISDTTITNESGWQVIPLAGVFADADGDLLTLEATSSNYAVAFGYIQYLQGAELVVLAGQRGTAQITVTANDERGGTVSDTFTVKVKAAPAVTSALADVDSLDAAASKRISLSGVFSDADGDSLTVTAASSDEGRATVSVSADQSALTVSGVSEGTVTITVTARDADGNTVSDAFEVVVVGKYAALIAQVYEWRNDPNGVNNKNHTDRWDRALLAFGETVADTSLTAMTAAEAREMAGKYQASRWNPVAEALREIEAGQQQQEQATPNRAPTVSSAVADATIVSESGTRQVSLSGVFADADGDELTVTASSSDESVATVSVASDGSSLTVSAEARGTATITVTADDGNGGTVSDTFTVKVKAAPAVASALADVGSLDAAASKQISLSGVFSDADGDSLTVTAASSDEGRATVSVSADQSALTVSGVSEGTVTITVTARDADGNTVSDAFEVVVVGKYAALIAQVYEWRNDPNGVNNKNHTDRWDRALLAFGETVADTSLTAMTAAEAREMAGKYQASRWNPVAEALREIEAGQQQQEQATPNRAPTVSSAVADATIVSESGTRQVSLSGVFADADGDELTVTASSSDESVATVSVAADQSTLTVSANSRGTATITVNASDGGGGAVEDSFTVTVKSAPTVASALADVSGLEAGASRDVSLSEVFSDADGDSLTVTASSSDDAKSTVSVSADGSRLTVAAVAVGTATITVTARDADGNTVQDAFDVVVVRKYAALIAQVYQWRNDPNGVNNKSHTDRWDRALLAFGETVADTSLTAMTAAEAREMAGKYQASRWNPVAEALAEIEAG